MTIARSCSEAQSCHTSQLMKSIWTNMPAYRTASARAGDHRIEATIHNAKSANGRRKAAGLRRVIPPRLRSEAKPQANATSPSVRLIVPKPGTTTESSQGMAKTNIARVVIAKASRKGLVLYEAVLLA